MAIIRRHWLSVTDLAVAELMTAENVGKIRTLTIDPNFQPACSPPMTISQNQDLASGEPESGRAEGEGDRQ